MSFRSLADAPLCFGRANLVEFKEILKEQFFILVQQQERAAAAIPLLYLPWTRRADRCHLLGWPTTLVLNYF